MATKADAGDSRTAAAALPTPTVHELKCWPAFFPYVIGGVKTFESRRRDRDFKVGDTLWLREFDPASGNYTGRETHRRVTYLTDWMQLPGYVAMAIAKVEGR